MKVFALGILLVSLYCIEGAVVKRQAEEEGQVQEVPTEEAALVSKYFPGLADFFKTDTLDQYAAQTRTFFQQLQERIMNEQMTDRIGQAFTSIIESAKRAVQ